MVYNKGCCQLLLSLLLLSCIIAPKRELANILLLFDTYTLFNSEIHNTMNMNMKTDTLRDQSANSSTNNSRKALVQSSISFIPYIKRMEVQNNNYHKQIK